MDIPALDLSALTDLELLACPSSVHLFFVRVTIEIMVMMRHRAYAFLSQCKCLDSSRVHLQVTGKEMSL